MKFFKNFSTFHKIFFLVFFIFNVGLSITHIVQAEGMHEAFSPLMLISLVSALTGIFAAIYTARGQVVAYIWGFFNVISYIFVSISGHMYGEVLLYVLYMLPMQFVGFYAWRKSAKQSSEGTVEAKRMTKKHWIIFGVFFVIFWASYGTLVYNLPAVFDNLFGITITHDKEFLIDSLTATLTVCAVVLATNRFIEQWYLWIIADAIGILLYISALIHHGGFSISALSGAMMWCQFTINSIYGFIVWRKLQKKKDSAKLAESSQIEGLPKLDLA
ncbi:nicotinamide riboside transporter PnuC [uncultured Clostridium sp.]|jgi:nicotinamide mononucleotide transporter|uniref:nicotinamide riboside transporter PnuC n=1 Tax=uncultured Clostridium sp. TaxID=59620 RepID=UPI002633114D|nr:nicotinamide riboside transporter PnuC [uncultured Clostridium sp.]